MRLRNLWRAVPFCMLITLVPGGAGLAAAQTDAQLRAAIENLTRRLGSPENALGPLRSLERELRDGSLLAVVGKKRVAYIEPAAVRESLKREVVQTILAKADKTGDRDSLGKISDEDYVNSMVTPLEQEVVKESNAFLQKLTHDRDWVETRIRLLREELERTEQRLGGKAEPPLPESGAQGQLVPPSQRVCPSPLFGKLLWSGSTPTCIGKGHTLFPGWRFGENTAFVCAKCTPNCFFAETTGGRLICVVTGVPDTAAGPTTPGKPPAPGTRPPAPSPRRTYSLSGTWQPAAGGPDVSVMTGGPTRYMVSGTGAGTVRSGGTLTGDGTTFEGSFKDVPGYCCGRDGYVWLEVIDENSYRARSVWWTPGRGSKEKPSLTFGWSTWTRQGAAASTPSSSSARAQEDLEARKKALGKELDDIRQAGKWVADHHVQVGTYVGNARTSAQLNATDTLMRNYAACYDTKNAATALIFEAARAGRYPTPGDRIGELSKVTAAFNGCMEAAISKWRAATR